VVVLDLSSPIIEDRGITAMLYRRTATTMLNPSTPVTTTRDRAEGIWPDPVPRPRCPTGVLILRGIWLGPEAATAKLWLPPDLAAPFLPGHGVHRHSRIRLSDPVGVPLVGHAK